MYLYKGKPFSATTLTIIIGQIILILAAGVKQEHGGSRKHADPTGLEPETPAESTKLGKKDV